MFWKRTAAWAALICFIGFVAVGNDPLPTTFIISAVDIVKSQIAVMAECIDIKSLTPNKDSLSTCLDRCQISVADRPFHWAIFGNRPRPQERFAQANGMFEFHSISSKNIEPNPKPELVSGSLTEILEGVVALNEVTPCVVLNKLQRPTVAGNIGPQLALGGLFSQKPLLFTGVPQAIGGKPQLNGRLPETPRKQGYETGEKRGQQPVVNVKKFSNLPYRDKSDFVAGALLMLGIIALFITLITGGNEKDESNNKHRPDN